MTAVHESGGVLVSASWPDGTTLTTPLSSVSGRITDAKTGHGVPDIDVAIPWTIYHTRTAGDGTFTLADLVPGGYPVTVFDSSLATFGIVRSRGATINTSAVPKGGITIALDSTVTIARKACAAKPIGTGDGIIAVLITDPPTALNPVEVTFMNLPGATQANRQMQLLDEHPNTTVLGGIEVTSRGGPMVLCGAGSGPYILVASDSIGGRHGHAMVTVKSGALDTARIAMRPPGVIPSVVRWAARSGLGGTSTACWAVWRASWDGSKGVFWSMASWEQKALRPRVDQRPVRSGSR